MAFSKSYQTIPFLLTHQSSFATKYDGKVICLSLVIYTLQREGLSQVRYIAFPHTALFLLWVAKTKQSIWFPYFSADERWQANSGAHKMEIFILCD